MLADIKVGDKVIRLLAGTIPMELNVTEITENRIICGWWTFSRRNGAEIDDDLGWNESKTGSVLQEMISDDHVIETKD